MQFHERSYFSKHKLIKQSVSRIFGSLLYRWKYHSQTFFELFHHHRYILGLSTWFSLNCPSIWTLLRKKRLIRLSKPHSLMWHHTPSFYPPLQAVTKSWVWVFQLRELFISGILWYLSVCVFVTKLVLQTHWTKWHVLTHFYLGLIICRTHSYKILPIYPGLMPPPPSLIRVFVGVSDVLFILDLQCVCRAMERELILFW